MQQYEEWSNRPKVRFREKKEVYHGFMECMFGFSAKKKALRGLSLQAGHGAYLSSPFMRR